MAFSRVGFVGLGKMGREMATNLVKAGFVVCGYDLDRAAAEAFAQCGGTVVDTAPEAARGAQILIIVVHSAEQVDEVLFGEDPTVATLPRGATVVIHSTVSPAYISDLAKRLAETGHQLLDAPVSGGASGAHSSSLIVMCSGSAAAFEAAVPALMAVASKVYRFGDAPGAGSVVKMINQLLVGVHIAVAAEAIAFAARAGVNLPALCEIICAGVGNSAMFATRAPRMLENDYTSLRSAVENFVKDLGIVLQVGSANQFPLPIAAAAHQQFLAAEAAGFGQLDDAAVVRVYERLSGVEFAPTAKSADALTAILTSCAVT